MLSIGAMGHGQGDYYLGLAREDYYLSGGEPAGVWLGQGAQTLGLTGVVEAGALTRLLEGFHPEENGRPLIQNAGAKDHQPGWDLTFSAPKSVSVLWSQVDPQIRKVLQDCHFAAVQTALAFIEETAAITRRGKGGHIKENAQLIIAAFEHGTSRAQDPQLHTHCLVMNACTREDGTSGTIESKLLYLAKMATGALYRAELAVLLEQVLGLTIDRKGSCFEIRGIPEDVLEEFSKRRGEIEMLLEEKGYESSAAAAMAALATRQIKTLTPREHLFDECQKTGKKFNWGPEQAAQFLREAQPPERDPQQEKEAALVSAMKRSTEEKSYFNEREFIRYVAEEAQGRGFGAQAVRQISKEYLEQSPEIVPLGVYKHENLYSTREMMAIERSLLQQVEKSKSQFHVGVSEQVLKGVVGARHRLNEEQAVALRHVCDSGPGSIRIVSGMAGTGKTTFLDAARFAWTLEGFQVHGFALPGKAAKGLGTGTYIKHDTLHRTLWNLQSGKLRLNPKSVLVLDEAGMVGTRQMEKLVTAALKTGARLVIVGDQKQLQPIEAGGALPEMERLLRPATLTKILRQRDQWARDAVTRFSEGGANEALRAYAQRSLLSVSPDRKAAYGELVKAWCEEGIRAPEEQLIFTGTHLDATILNRLVQQKRREAGAIEKESVPAPEGGGAFHVGDRVMFTQKSRLYGLDNGDLGTVVAVDSEKGTLAARLDGSDARVTVGLGEYPHVRLGYALTTHKGQGVTIERSFVLVGGLLQHRESTYVQASRARGETRLFADQDTAGEDLARLVEQMNKSRPKEMAHTVQARATQTSQRSQRSQGSRRPREQLAPVPVPPPLPEPGRTQHREPQTPSF